MKTLYIDCGMGAAGDMLTAALLELVPDEQEAVKALKIVGIDETDFEKSPLELSGGQKRRVAIAGILAMKPSVLVLDEPTAGLDPQGATAMMELFSKLNKESGITVIIVTHNMEHVLEYCDEVVVLENGEMILHTDVRNFFSQPEYMERALIDPPVVIQFRKLCAAHGVTLSEDILTLDELVREIAGRKHR